MIGRETASLPWLYEVASHVSRRPRQTHRERLGVEAEGALDRSGGGHGEDHSDGGPRPVPG